MNNQPLKLLLVDDDTSWQRIYRFYLENKNVMVETVTNRGDALKIVNQEGFDIAVIDLRLVANDDTNFDGIEVVRHIQKTNPLTRVVIKSGYTEEAKIKMELEKLKVDGIFDKGKPIEDFVNAVLRIARSLQNPMAEESDE